MTKIRMKSKVRGLTERAARGGEDTLLDRTVFLVSPTVYRQILARLDAPPKPNERLRRTMRTPAPWD